MTATVVNINKIAGGKAIDYDIYIGRGSGYGNPFVIGRDGTREEVIQKFREYFYSKEGAGLRELIWRDFHSCTVRFGCHCKPEACHGDIYAEYLNGK